MKVNEIFFSIQGEGIHIGLPTVFLRLFACDLRCRWCDTMYAVEGSDFQEIETQEVLSRVLGYGCSRVCITGGEPLIQRQAVENVAESLLERDFTVVLETSGNKKPPEIFSHPNSVVSMDCKCPGSGMAERMDFSLYDALEEKDQLKFVIADEGDYEYARGILAERSIRASVIFQPVWGAKADWIAQSVLRDCMENVRVLPQLHKIFWGEKRGV
ncbi:MAG: 4Fe-4S cluster-binding domain-containing protein [Candidatus Dadabacteria bacterium]|nr:4Fe-4S cluster-binding domain-containing protein [Candidatus Dadabacteria bacterium]